MDLLQILKTEYQSDWVLRDRSKRTVDEYQRYLSKFLATYPEPDLPSALHWLCEFPSAASRRQAARSIRSFGAFLDSRGVAAFSWSQSVPLAQEKVRPQPTVTELDLFAARECCRTTHERALVEVLWSSGMRRSEIARMRIEDIEFTKHWVEIPQSKTNQPRRAPLSREAVELLRLVAVNQTEGFVFELTADGIGALLKRRGLKSAHAWRRGWAVDSLRKGISEVSVRTAAGWRSGAMVSRYVAALSQDLSMAEFRQKEANTPL